MTKRCDYILAKSIKNGGQPLVEHLSEVGRLAGEIARNLGLNTDIAYKGAVLHDIGKASPHFQQSLQENYQRMPGFVFRHELASLFFISLFGEEEKFQVIEMIVGHHKSIYHDAGEKGILDLVNTDAKCLERHLDGFEDWSLDALSILEELGIKTQAITRQQAENNFWEVVDYCEAMPYGYSLWKGVLMAADHLASALGEKMASTGHKLFVTPDLQYYHNRKSGLYPLSLISAQDSRIHTLVTAPTGAGKTDFLLRRCKNRVFYVLPFQASINAMYERIKDDLKDTDADVRLLHASSSLKMEAGKLEEKILQRHVGSSVKVLTPHQLASIAFATKGYEALIADIKGCDIILDEIHTYSGTMQGIVKKLVEIFCSLGCALHIGTATMPTDLYNQLLEIMGEQNVYQVKLPNNILDTFDRHIVYKSPSFESLSGVIEQAIKNRQKILVVCNRVKKAQQLYETLAVQYPDVQRMLIHSRFKRIDRISLESKLKNQFNSSLEACIVVSTQVVEVSLDISFDLMITECAPVDALIQRFGRINRKRSPETIGTYKPVYVIAPPSEEREARPYNLDVLKRTFDALPDAEVLKESRVQMLIDCVYPQVEEVNIDLNAAFNKGKWQVKKLWHYPKSALLDALDIDSVACIDECDRELYECSNYEEQVKMEIPVSYKSVARNQLQYSTVGSKPFVIPHQAYDSEMGFLADFAKPEFYDISLQFL